MNIICIKKCETIHKQPYKLGEYYTYDYDDYINRDEHSRASRSDAPRRTAAAREARSRTAAERSAPELLVEEAARVLLPRLRRASAMIWRFGVIVLYIILYYINVICTEENTASATSTVSRGCNRTGSECV